jgi:hypothetical protein
MTVKNPELWSCLEFDAAKFTFNGLFSADVDAGIPFNPGYFRFIFAWSPRYTVMWKADNSTITEEGDLCLR